MSLKYCLDADVVLSGSANEAYDRTVLPTLWERIAEKKSDIVVVEPIYDEIEPGVEDSVIRSWLQQQGFQKMPMDGSAAQQGIEWRGKYQTKSQGKGASENDISLIAYAKTHGHAVVTFEGMQSNRPGAAYNYKIPLICKDEGVECLNFVGMLQRLQIKV